MHPLTDFLDDLLRTGHVTVAGQLTPFADDDQAAATDLLRDYHAADALDAPGPAPAFEPAAAGWAAEFLYRTTQLAFLRDYDEQAIAAHLPDWPGRLTAEVIFSVDLLFRYLPTLLALARGLAPADPLVRRLRAVAERWPLSFVGVAPAPAETPANSLANDSAEAPTNEPVEAPENGLASVLAHPTLRARYVERVIERRDRPRAAPPAVAEGIREALGDHADLLWPGFAPPVQLPEAAAPLASAE